MLTVDGVLHAIRRHDTLVVGFGVTGLDLTLQHHPDGIFDHMMNVALPNDSSDPDEVFTVSSGTEVSGL
jgi:hypothetical protein